MKIEDEEVPFLFIENGYRCLIGRSFGGFLLGYVELPKTLNFNSEKALCNFKVHGGITFLGSFEPRNLEEIKNLRLKINENSRWIGFDCGHYGKDIIPIMPPHVGRSENMMEIHDGEFIPMRRRYDLEPYSFIWYYLNLSTYKGVNFVKNELKKLVAQLNEL